MSHRATVSGSGSAMTRRNGGEFKARFFAELKNRKDLVDQLAGMARKGRVTLVCGSKEERFNNAAALKEYLESRTKRAVSKKTASV